MNRRTLQFVSGFMLMVIGIRWWSYDHTQYILGIGFILWGASSVLLAWLAKDGGDGRSGNEQIAGIIYIIGCVLAIIGLFLQHSN
jgi:uncharacterized membrane protein